MTLAAAAAVGAGFLTADALTSTDVDASTVGSISAPATAPAVASATATATATAAPAAPSTTAVGAAPSAPTTPTASPTTNASAFPDGAIYVGKAPGTRISVAVAFRGGKAVAYVCDGRSLESWQTGIVSDDAGEPTASGDRAALHSGRDSLTVQRTATGAQVTGTVRGIPVSVAATSAGAPAGLYRLTTRAGTTVGWIVLPDGAQVGVVSRRDGVEPAPPMTPGHPVEVDGISATPQGVRGDDGL